MNTVHLINLHCIINSFIYLQNLTKYLKIEIKYLYLSYSRIVIGTLVMLSSCDGTNNLNCNINI